MFEWGVGDISKLAAKVYAAYKDAPDDYKHISISEDVMSLQTILNSAVQHFGSTAFSDNDQQEYQEVLKGCERVLQDLNFLLEKYNSRDSTNTIQVFKGVKPGAEGIAMLRARLISAAGILYDFIQRFDIPNHFRSLLN